MEVPVLHRHRRHGFAHDRDERAHLVPALELLELHLGHDRLPRVKAVNDHGFEVLGLHSRVQGGPALVESVAQVVPVRIPKCRQPVPQQGQRAVDDAAERGLLASLRRAQTELDDLTVHSAPPSRIARAGDRWSSRQSRPNPRVVRESVSVSRRKNRQRGATLQRRMTGAPRRGPVQCEIWAGRCSTAEKERPPVESAEERRGPAD